MQPKRLLGVWKNNLPSNMKKPFLKSLVALQFVNSSQQRRAVFARRLPPLRRSGQAVDFHEVVIAAHSARFEAQDVLGEALGHPVEHLFALHSLEFDAVECSVLIEPV